MGDYYVVSVESDSSESDCSGWFFLWPHRPDPWRTQKDAAALLLLFLFKGDLHSVPNMSSQCWTKIGAWQRNTTPWATYRKKCIDNLILLYTNMTRVNYSASHWLSAFFPQYLYLSISTTESIFDTLTPTPTCSHIVNGFNIKHYQVFYLKFTSCNLFLHVTLLT